MAKKSQLRLPERFPPAPAAPGVPPSAVSRCCPGMRVISGYLPVTQSGDAYVEMEYRLFSKEEIRSQVDKPPLPLPGRKGMNKPVVPSWPNGNAFRTFASISVNGLTFIGRTFRSVARKCARISNPHICCAEVILQ
ncbi:hypothetical protein KCP69_26855 (plasmid) [Salmonella enterica subsp. enterica]|nr:hypothetical protein KCP69_26855 [Salmonella enterica subsp. enterica]